VGSENCSALYIRHFLGSKVAFFCVDGILWYRHTNTYVVDMREIEDPHIKSRRDDENEITFCREVSRNSIEIEGNCEI
jgi:hypothetical protein